MERDVNRHPVYSPSGSGLFSPKLVHYAVSKLAAAVFAAFCLIGWPVRPPSDLPPASMREVTGGAIFRELRPSQISGALFYVNDMRMHCRIGLFDGLNGCAFLRKVITDGLPVKATYYLMPTRIGIRYPLLCRLEQNGRAVVSPQQIRDYVMRSHEDAWLAYLQLVILFFSVAMTAGFIDHANATQKDALLPGDSKPSP
jgi:hypothetical protein